MDEIAKIVRARLANGHDAAGGVMITAATKAGAREFLVKGRDAAACMRFDTFDRVIIRAGAPVLVEKNVKLKGEEAPMDISKQNRHPATGQYTSDARTVYRDAMTAHINSVDSFDSQGGVDAVIAEARKVARAAVAAAGFDVDDIVTGSHNDDPSLDPRRVASTPEPAAKAMTADDIRKRDDVIAKGIAMARGIVDQAIIERCDMDTVLLKRLKRERTGVGGVSDALLKSDDNRITSLFGRTPLWSSGDPIAKSADPIETRIAKGQDLDSAEFVEAAMRRIARGANITDVWAGRNEPVSKGSYRPGLTVDMFGFAHAPETDALDLLQKRLEARDQQGVSGISKLLR